MGANAALWSATATRHRICFVNLHSVDRIIFSILSRLNGDWKTAPSEFSHKQLEHHPAAPRLRPSSVSLIMQSLLQGPSLLLQRGRNGFDGITGQKMRAEDHGLAKNMELKLTADQPLALAA